MIFSLPRIIVAVAAAAIAFAALAAAPAFAEREPTSGSQRTTHLRVESQTLSIEKPRKTKMLARFEIDGTVKTVSPSNVTVAVKRGNLHRLQGQTVTVVVSADTRMSVGSRRGRVLEVAIGDRISIIGSPAKADNGVTYNARHIRVQHRASDIEAPTS